MKSRQRRNFLKTAAITSSTLAMASCSDKPNSAPQPASKPDTSPDSTEFKPNVPVDNPANMTYGTLLCGGYLVNTISGEKKYQFTQVDIDKTIANKVADNKLIDDIGFLAHGVISNPLTRRGVIVFEKKGQGCAEIDLKENKIINLIQPSENHEFYGHGGYSSDGKTVFATEYHEDTYVGKMTVRDATDFKVIGDFPTYGEWPHDCQFIDDGKVVAITNGGDEKGESPTNVAYVDVATGKLIEKVEWPESPQFNAGHLLISPDGDLVIAHAVRTGLDAKKALSALSIRLKGGSIKTMTEGTNSIIKKDIANITEHMNGETLSLALHGNVLAATNPYALFEGKKKGMTTFWDLKKQRFLGADFRELPRGVGVTLNGQYWLITSGSKNTGAALVLTKSGREEFSFEAAAQGSHVYIHDFPA